MQQSLPWGFSLISLVVLLINVNSKEEEKMKNIVTSAVVGAMLVAGSAAADFSDAKPYAGVDYYHAIMKVKSDAAAVAEGRGVKLPKTYPGASVYAGIKFMENFGAELGADFGKKKFTDADGDKVSVKRNGAHLDLMGFWPLNDCVNLIGSLGAGYLKPKVGDDKMKGTFFPRVGAGASYMFTDMFGLRLKANWENTSRLKTDDSVKLFKDTVSFTVGAFAQF